MCSHLSSTRSLLLIKKWRCSLKLSRSTMLTWTSKEVSRPISLSGALPQHHLSVKLWKQAISRMTTLPGKQILTSCTMQAVGPCLYVGIYLMKTLRHFSTKLMVSFSEAEPQAWLIHKQVNKLSSTKARSASGNIWSVKKMRKASTSLSLASAKASN